MNGPFTGVQVTPAMGINTPPYHHRRSGWFRSAGAAGIRFRMNKYLLKQYFHVDIHFICEIPDNDPDPRNSAEMCSLRSLKLKIGQILLSDTDPTSSE